MAPKASRLPGLGRLCAAWSRLLPSWGRRRRLPPSPCSRSVPADPGGAASLVLSEAGDSASAAYFLHDPALDARAVDWATLAAGRTDGARPCRLLIVLRYLPPGRQALLRSLRERGVRVAYFMDDDLMDPEAVAELPEPYRSRVRREALGQRQRIEALCHEFWVSTPYLAQKYAAWQPRLIEPRPARASLLAGPPVWVCYHGTASHQAELDWLLPLMRQVQAQAQGTRFEVFGDHAVYKRFRELPRVNVLHPMSWPNYLDYTAGVRREIALAPLQPSRFNAGRGHTKFFDFARMGAVGLYSDRPPYRGFVRDGVDGLLLPDDPAAWVQAIVALAADAPRRERMAAAARERALALAWGEALPPPAPSAKPPALLRGVQVQRAPQPPESVWRWALDAPAHDRVADLATGSLTVQGWLLLKTAGAQPPVLLSWWDDAVEPSRHAFNGDRRDVIERALREPVAGHPQLRCGFRLNLPLPPTPPGQLRLRLGFELPDGEVFEAAELRFPPTSQVIEGREGWLYLDNDSNRSVDQFTGRLLLTADQQQQWRQYLADAAALAARHACRHALLIAPSKEEVLPQHHPQRRALTTVLDQVRELAGPDAPVLDAAPLLRAQPDPAACFKRTDTHWTDRGASVALLAVLERMGYDGARLRAALAGDRYKTLAYPGDLGIKLLPPQSAPTEFLDAPPAEDGAVFDNRLPNIGRVIVFRAEAPVFDEALLVFGASSAYPMLKSLKRLFARTVFVHSAAQIDAAVLAHERPAALLLQSNGRFLIQPPTAGFDLRAVVAHKLGEADAALRAQLDALRAEADGPEPYYRAMLEPR